MIIQVLEQGGSEGGEPRVVQEVEVSEVGTDRVKPFQERVGDTMTVDELRQVLTQVEPLEPFKPDEPESYYAQSTLAWRDGDLSDASIDIPHHVGLRLVLDSLLHEYGQSENLVVQIG